MTVINSIADRADELKGWRRELHQHPEICYEEVWTSDFVAAKLESFGICLLYTSPSPRDWMVSRMPSSA